MIYGQLADDLRFLRTMAAYGRQNILSFLAVKNPEGPKLSRNAVEYTMGEDKYLPSVFCRLTSRNQLNWARVYRSLFPDNYHSIKYQEEQVEHLGFSYQSRLTFSMDRRIPVEVVSEADKGGGDVVDD